MLPLLCEDHNLDSITEEVFTFFLKSVSDLNFVQFNFLVLKCIIQNWNITWRTRANPFRRNLCFFLCFILLSVSCCFTVLVWCLYRQFEININKQNKFQCTFVPAFLFNMRFSRKRLFRIWICCMQAEWGKITVLGDIVRSTTTGIREKAVSSKLWNFPRISQKCNLLLKITTVMYSGVLQTSCG